MKKPALRKNRYKTQKWIETNWTTDAKSLGEYIFRRLSIDQSSKTYSRIRPRHNLSKLIVQSKEIDSYISDYLKLQESKRLNSANLANLERDVKVRRLNIRNFPTS